MFKANVAWGPMADVIALIKTNATVLPLVMFVGCEKIGPKPFAMTTLQMKRAKPPIGITTNFTRKSHLSFETLMYRNGRLMIQKRKKQSKLTDVMLALSGSWLGIRSSKDGTIAFSIWYIHDPLTSTVSSGTAKHGGVLSGSFDLPRCELHAAPEDGNDATYGDCKLASLQSPASSVHNRIVEPSLRAHISREGAGNHDQAGAEHNGAHGHARTQSIRNQ